MDAADIRQDLEYVLFTKEQIAPLFKGSHSNCYFDLEWQPLLGDSHNYWM